MKLARKHVNALALGGVLFVHAGLLAYSATRHSPTFNELGHLPAGICHWQYAMFELYRVNPPLARMVAAVPVLLFCDPKTDWGNYQLDPLSRETIPMGIRFAKANGPRTFFLFTVARWAYIPFCLLGAWTCYRWASDLWGGRSGWAALLLWCFNPFVLGFGALVKPDVPAAAVGVWACYRFWKWLGEPTWPAAGVAGIALGLAELTKFTLLVFFLIWPAAWLVKRLGARRGPRAALLRRELGQLASILGLALVMINFGYAFAGWFEALGDYRFQSRVLSSQPIANPPRAGNRFAGTWLGHVPVPLPRDYVQGIDRQRTDFELGERSYLCGHWQERGWWYYHLFGLAIKTPLGTLALLGMTICLTVTRITARGTRAAGPRHGVTVSGSVAWAVPTPLDELYLLAPAVVILALVSSQTGFSNHVRYTIPALPYLFIWCGKCLSVLQTSRLPAFVVQASGLPIPAYRSRWLAVVCWTCVAATALASLAVYPHSVSYFNLLVGGPKYGHNYLLESNVACGQDLLFLKQWCDRNPQARPLGVASFGWIDPELAGIEYTLPPLGPSHSLASGGREPPVVGTADARQPRPSAVGGGPQPPRAPRRLVDVESVDDLGPQPGWYAIDVNFLHGTPAPAACRGWRWQRIEPNGPNFEYFRFFEPCDRVAHSFLIYHITAEEANRVRRELGLRRLARTPEAP